MPVCNAVKMVQAGSEKGKAGCVYACGHERLGILDNLLTRWP